MLPEAHIAHHLPGRTRLRIGSRRNDADYFAALEGALRGWAGVTGVVSNPLTAGILIEHTVPIGELEVKLEAEGLAAVTGPLPVPRADTERAMKLGLRELNHGIETASRGALDLQGALVLLFGGLAIHQALKGAVLAPAVTLLWYAMNAASLTERDPL